MIKNEFKKKIILMIIKEGDTGKNILTAHDCIRNVLTRMNKTNYTNRSVMISAFNR